MTVGDGSGFSVGDNVSLTTTYTPETSAITNVTQDASEVELTFTDATDLKYFQPGDDVQIAGRVYSDHPINVSTTVGGGPEGAFNGEFNPLGANPQDTNLPVGFEFVPPLTGVTDCQLAVNKNQNRTIVYVDANDQSYTYTWNPDQDYVLSTNTPTPPSTIKSITYGAGQITGMSINGVVLIDGEPIEVVSIDIANNKMRVSGGDWTTDSGNSINTVIWSSYWTSLTGSAAQYASPQYTGVKGFNGVYGADGESGTSAGTDEPQYTAPDVNTGILWTPPTPIAVSTNVQLKAYIDDFADITPSQIIINRGQADEITITKDTAGVPSNETFTYTFTPSSGNLANIALVSNSSTAYAYLGGAIVDGTTLLDTPGENQVSTLSPKRGAGTIADCFRKCIDHQSLDRQCFCCWQRA